MNKEYTTITCVNGQILISEMSLELDDNGFYTLTNPVKPVPLDDGKSVVFIRANPFSDSTTFKIHATHVMLIGSLDATYINDYEKIVHKIESTIQDSYSKLAESPEYDELLNSFDTPNTLQ